mgnify:CR=1 FL=1
MKRLISIFAFFICILNFNSTHADNIYQDYFNGNRNYLFCYSSMFAEIENIVYLDKKSLVVQKYDPPIYTLAVNICSIRRDYGESTTKLQGYSTLYFMYKLKPRSMYILRNGSWHHLSAVYEDYSDSDIEFVRAGEMAFYIAYKMKFYGDRDWMNPKTHEIRKSIVNDSQLYLIVDGAI